MSVRYMMSRVGARAAQAVRDAVGRSAGKADRAQAQQQSMARAGRAPAESARAKAPLARKAAEEQRRRAAAQEESLRTVMFLSMWGPNA
ncbi:uncharacterized protein [Triticum aestivum]|nr:uncharacterized protein LOC123050477 [Triticum aestivum]